MGEGEREAKCQMKMLHYFLLPSLMLKKLKTQLWDWRGALITAPTISLLIIGLRSLGLLQSLEWAAFDQYFRLRPSETTDERIIIVGLDEDDIKKFQQWPINDAILAELLNKIKAQQPRAIGLDFYRDFSVEPGHQDLVEVFETTPNLVGIELIDEADSKKAVAPPPVLDKLGQVGFNNVQVDHDGRVRRGLFFLNKNEQPFPSFNYYLSALYLEKEGLVPQPTEADPLHFYWGKGFFQPFASNDGAYINADDGGYQLLLNYRGSAKTFRTVTMTEVLDNRVPADLFRDRLVLIGATAISLNDFFYTPYSNQNLAALERTAGVEIQANLISQIISAAMDGRVLLKTWSDPVEWAWIVFWSSLSAGLVWKWRYLGGMRQFSLKRMAGPIFCLGGLFLTTYPTFLIGWWLPVVPPLLGLAGSWLAITAYVALTAGDIRRTFGRYLSDDVVATLLESPQGLKLGGERRKITILTSDLRGFTALSERLQPEEVVRVLNLYLKHISAVITKYQGTIDKYMGDGILVLFGAPTARENDTERAVACAVAMQLAMEAINQEVTKLGFPELQMGIGVNTGDVVLGNIGSEAHTEYSVIGRDVNLAYRIESYTIGGQIMVSESTVTKVKSMVKIDGQKQVLPKGVKEPITIYEIGGIYGKHNLFLTKKEAQLLPIFPPIPVKYTLLEGKHIDENVFDGSLIKLSEQGAEMESNQRRRDDRPSDLSNIKLNLLNEDQVTYGGDIYAKVVSSQNNNQIVYIYFTSLAPDMEQRLDVIYKQLKSV